MVKGRIKKPSDPLSIWRERESIDSTQVNSLVGILNGPGCEWSRRCGCLMCGYGNDVLYEKVTASDLKLQIDSIMDKWDGEEYVKIFSSGSFLDKQEIPESAQIYLFERVAEANPELRVLVESRPEYISRTSLNEFKRHVQDIEVAIGLETYTDFVRLDLIRKGFTYKDFVRAADKIISNGSHLKTYLLLKPPLLGEQRSIEECILSIEKVSSRYQGSTISINPMNIQRNTVVENLFNKGFYTPPWLRSLIEVLEEGYALTEGTTRLMSSPTAGGKRRGAHNCGKCDEEQLTSIEMFSLDNNAKLFYNDQKCCLDLWELCKDSSILDPMAADANDIRRSIKI